MARMYYLCEKIHYPDDLGVEVYGPRLPTGMTEWVALDNVGRNCMIVMSLGDFPAVPQWGRDVQLPDLLGLTDAELHAQLPIAIPPGMAQNDADMLTQQLGFNPVDVEVLRTQMRIRGQ